MDVEEQEQKNEESVVCWAWSIPLAAIAGAVVWLVSWIVGSILSTN